LSYVGSGELIEAKSKVGELSKGGVPYQEATGVSETPIVPTLADQGVDKNLGCPQRWPPDGLNAAGRMRGPILGSERPGAPDQVVRR
jgi:hypothetical protein